MNNLQLGKMYLVKEFFWFVFPTKKVAGVAMREWPGADGAVSLLRATYNAKRLSEYYWCDVFVVEPNTCVVLLEVDEPCYKLLDSNGNIGWTYCCDDFSRYFKIVKE